MRSLNRSLLFPLTAWLAFGALRAQAQTTPEVLHYKFSGTGTSVPNLASAPPPGAANATIMGGLTQSGADLNTGGGGFSLMGSGVSSATDYLNTGWAPNLGTGSWTIAFISSNITSSSTLFYIFGDVNTSSFRCFTNGVAGPNNWILRGAGLTDVYVNGGATVATHRIAFVYDNALNNVKGYLDGVLVSTVAQAPGGVNVTGTGPFKVMGYGTNVGAPAGGLLDDFRVYSRALSAAEVAEINIQPVVVVTGNAVAIGDGDSTPDVGDDTDFGSLPPGNSSLHTFTVSNTGNADLTLGSVSVSGSQAADFSVTAQPVTPVAPGADTTFQVTFAPGALGLRSATLSLATNDPGRNPFDFAIQGTGICPTITLGSLPNGNVNVPYTGSATASGGTGPYTYAVTSGVLPGGLSLTTSGAGVGTLSGTPTTTGTYPFSITATDTSWSGTCTGVQNYNVVIDPEPGQDFHTLTPCRVVDTRNAGAGPLGGPALEALGDRIFVLAGSCGIPMDAKSVSLNIAVTGPTNPGNIRLHPGGTAVPLVSSINFKAGQTRSNNAVVRLSGLGELAAYLDQISGTAHLILDVNGYFK